MRVTWQAAYQTPRINAKAIGGAASAQCVSVSMAMALAETFIQQRSKDVQVCSPLESTSHCLSFLLSPVLDSTLDWLREQRARVPVMSTSQLVFNSVPAKLSATSIRNAAQRLANMELNHQAISERVASSNHMLTAICRSVAGGYEIDVRSPQTLDGDAFARTVPCCFAEHLGRDRARGLPVERPARASAACAGRPHRTRPADSHDARDLRPRGNHAAGTAEAEPAAPEQHPH